MEITTEWKGVFMKIKITDKQYILSTDCPYKLRQAYARGNGTDKDLIKAMDAFERLASII